jgi:hypothetical protein
MADFWNELAPEVRERIELGEASVKRLKRGEHIEWWLNAGRALADLQAEAMRHAGTNVNKGPRYNEAWTTLARHAPELTGLDKSDRSHAVWLATEWEVVNAWLHTLAVNERLALNHPRAIHRRYDAAHLPPTAETARKAAAHAQPVDAMEIIRQLRGGVFSPGTSMEEVASTLHASVSYDAFKRLVAACLRLMEPEDRQDRIEAQVRERTERNAKAKARRTASKPRQPHS